MYILLNKTISQQANGLQPGLSKTWKVKPGFLIVIKEEGISLESSARGCSLPGAATQMKDCSCWAQTNQINLKGAE